MKEPLNKVEILERLAPLLGVSISALLGVGEEYLGSAVSYFERVRQIEETAQSIVVLAGPISFLVASDAFEGMLGQVLRESAPDHLPARAQIFSDIDQFMTILRARKQTFRLRQPTVVNLISAFEIERFLLCGFVGRSNLPPQTVRRRRILAAREVEHFAGTLEQQKLGMQLGVVRDNLPHAGFQLFRQADRRVLAVSPFRLGEQPNVCVGMAMITSAPEAVALHEQTVQEVWRRALKGAAGARYLRELIAVHATGRVEPQEIVDRQNA